jgi:hypothetical protein
MGFELEEELAAMPLYKVVATSCYRLELQQRSNGCAVVPTILC